MPQEDSSQGKLTQNSSGHDDHSFTRTRFKFWRTLILLIKYGGLAVAASGSTFIAHHFLYWPYEKQNILASIDNMLQQTNSIKLSRELTSIQINVASVEQELKKIDNKYAETMKILDEESGLQKLEIGNIQRNLLVVQNKYEDIHQKLEIEKESIDNSIKRIDLYMRNIEAKNKKLREDSALLQDNLQAGKAALDALSALSPNIEGAIDNTTMGRDANGMWIKLHTHISNMGKYSFDCTKSISIYGENSNSMDDFFNWDGPDDDVIDTGQKLEQSYTIHIEKEFFDHIADSRDIFTISFLSHCKPDDALVKLTKKHIGNIVTTKDLDRAINRYYLLKVLFFCSISNQNTTCKIS